MPPSGPEGNAGDADAGEFPSGEFPGEDGGIPGEGQTASAGDEPGFEDGASGTGPGAELPDMRDEPTLEDTMGAFEDAMGEAGGPPPGGGSQGTAGTGGLPSGGGPEGGATAGGSPYGIPGFPGGGSDSEQGEGSGSSGTMTPAEQVAILDARLERGTGEFDAMILEEQAAQRRAAREQAASQPPAGSGGTADSSPEGGMADAGGYSVGGGMPGAGMPGSGGGSSHIPQNTAKYPPPADIPSGTDDDVVARQLREAAMREPDPVVREKLWDEYRKYKGVSS